MSKSTSSIAIALLAAFGPLLAAGPPSGWYCWPKASYECNIDPSAAYYGQPSVIIKSKERGYQFGTMTQGFRGKRYLSKRVRFSAFVRSENISGPDGWAGLWMRVDEGPRIVAFDNMENRPVKGTTPWRNYEVVLDVPRDSTWITMGILLSGVGKVWISGAKFEVVGDNVPITSLFEAYEAEYPRDLGFEEQ